MSLGISVICDYNRKTKQLELSEGIQDQFDAYKNKTLLNAEYAKQDVKQYFYEALRKNNSKFKILEPKIESLFEELMDLIELEAADARKDWDESIKRFRAIKPRK